MSANTARSNRPARWRESFSRSIFLLISTLKIKKRFMQIPKLKVLVEAGAVRAAKVLP
jgi:hypothetical protein